MKDTLPAACSEAQLQDMVLDLARYCDWRVVHFRQGRTAKGWRTPVSGDGRGFPDLVLLRGAKQLVVELKAQRGRLTPEQNAWLNAFRLAGVDARVWRPADWSEIQQTLTQGATL
ncbi:MAG: VRR-NUC domain-containing protein [Acidimicrobiales bacterium]